MKRELNNRTLLAILAILLLCNSGSLAVETWFNQRVTWKYGEDGSPWSTTIKNPNGSREYKLILRPLWSVEGGVIALEIVLARPQQPDVNILGERESGVQYPFVVTVGELERGIARSKFGAVRTLQADDIILNVKIERYRSGKGVGSGSMYCAKCKNIRKLTMWVTATSKDK